LCEGHVTGLPEKLDGEEHIRIAAGFPQEGITVNDSTLYHEADRVGKAFRATPSSL
jgi:hypothetical protein